MDITVVGLGVVGGESFKEFSRLSMGDRVIGMDLNEQKRAEFRPKYNVSNFIPQSDAYIVATYTTQQVKDVLNSLDLARKPLISLESTLDPKEYDYFVKWAYEKDATLVTCPHRFNPNDKDHHVFNLDRVIGGTTSEATGKGIEFYTRFMPRELLHTTDFSHAALSKTMENAYRFLQIDTAQLFRQLCDELGQDFGDVRAKSRCVMLEAKTGIGGTCLPKDAQLIGESARNPLWTRHIQHNDRYTKVYANEREQKRKTPIPEFAHTVGLAHLAMTTSYSYLINDFCEEHGFDFQALRDLMNTKWNINVQYNVGKNSSIRYLEPLVRLTTEPLWNAHLRYLQ